MSDLNEKALFIAGKAIQTKMKNAGGEGVTFSELAETAIKTYCKQAKEELSRKK